VPLHNGLARRQFVISSAHRGGVNGQELPDAGDEIGPRQLGDGRGVLH
jgi:hypothetical protein